MCALWLKNTLFSSFLCGVYYWYEGVYCVSQNTRTSAGIIFSLVRKNQNNSWRTFFEFVTFSSAVLYHKQNKTYHMKIQGPDQRKWKRNGLKGINKRQGDYHKQMHQGKNFCTLFSKHLPQKKLESKCRKSETTLKYDGKHITLRTLCQTQPKCTNTNIRFSVASECPHASCLLFCVKKSQPIKNAISGLC